MLDYISFVKHSLLQGYLMYIILGGWVTMAGHGQPHAAACYNPGH